MNEARAREILDKWLNSDDSIGNPWWAMGWDKFYPDEQVGFTVDELEAIAWWMRNKSKE